MFGKETAGLPLDLRERFWERCIRLPMIDSKLGHLIGRGAETEELSAAARENGFVTMRESCQHLVLSGITTVEEAARVITSTAED